MRVDGNVLRDEMILRAYKNGKDVDDIDLPKINELASIGLIKKGMSFKRQQITAKTTSLGLKLIS